MGVELEVELADGEDQDRDSTARAVLEHVSNFCILKDDGSLNSGFEIVSCPCTLDQHKILWESFFNWKPTALLRSANTSTCGMHVHLSRAPLSHLQLGKMLVFINEPSNKWFIRRIAQRNSDRWAKVEKKKHSDCRHYPDERYQAVNLLNQNTVEFRIFKGNLKKESFFKNIEFVHALTMFCSPSDRSIKECMSVDHFVAFVAKNKKEYPNLHTFIAARSSQPKSAPINSANEESALA